MSKTVPQLGETVDYLIGSAAKIGVHEIPLVTLISPRQVTGQAIPPKIAKVGATRQFGFQTCG
jgi:hypothetical protein